MQQLQVGRYHHAAVASPLRSVVHSPSTSCEDHSLRSNRRRDHLWHLAKANEPNDNFYREVAARFGGRWLVRSNLRGPGDPEPSSRAVLNISELSVPGWDHAPYKVCAGAQEMHGMPESCCGCQQLSLPGWDHAPPSSCVRQRKVCAAARPCQCPA